MVSFTAASCELKLRLAHYPPHAFEDAQGQWRGIDVDVAVMLIKRVGCHYKIIEVPWARAISMLRSGKIDVMPSMSFKKERDEYAKFIGPVRVERIVLASPVNRPITLAQFKRFDIYNKPITIQRGAFYGSIFAEIYQSSENPETDFFAIPNNRIKLELLQKGRVSGLIEDELNIYYHLNKEPEFSGYKVHLTTLHQNLVYLAFSRRSVPTKQLQQLNIAYQQLSSSGQLDQIHQYYLNDYADKVKPPASSNQ